MITVTLKDNTVINMSYVTLVEPLRGSGEYQSYEVHISGRRESVAVFENDISRESFLATLATVS